MITNNYQPALENIPDIPNGRVRPQGPPQMQNMQPFEDIQGNTRILQFPDGSAAIEDMGASAQRPKADPEDHFQNLAKVLPEAEVRQIGLELKMAVEQDQASQEEYHQGIADVIQALGLNISSLEGGDDLPFQGAATIKSTALFESLVDMLATITSALFPPTGMVDSVIQGESTEKLEDLAYRIKLYFNWYLTQVAKEFKKEGRRTFLWAILTGSCYKKVYIDPILQRPVGHFIRPSEFIINAQYSTHLQATRKTHIIKMSGRDIKIMMRSGRYRDDETMLMTKNHQDDPGEIQEALDEISGVERVAYSVDLDTEYTLCEVHVDYHIKGDPKAPSYDLPIPYIVTFEKESGYVLDISRNWLKDDFLRKRREFFVNYPFFPALEGEGYGLLHYAGRLADAATGIKRQLINTATYANFPGGVYAAGIRLENNNLMPPPGTFSPVQTGGLPIDQTIMALPYKEPSPALATLLASIEDSIKKPSAIINSKVAEMNSHAPVGSTLAMLENLHKVSNSILEGFHEAFGQELMLFYDRFGEWLPDNMAYPFKVPGGEHQIMKSDFNGDVRVIPASNPALQNSTYRFVQSEIILNQARQAADLHNLRFAYKYFYKNLGLSPEEISDLLPAPSEEGPPPPFSGDPVTENTYMMTNKPVAATIDQDHKAHRVVHSLIAANPQADPAVAAAAKAHDQEHEAMEFLIEMYTQMGVQIPTDPTQIPPEIQNQIAVMAATIAQQQLEALQQAQQPPGPPPIDPSMAALEIENMRSQQRRESDANKTQLETMKLALQETKVKTELALAEMKLQQEREKDLMKEELANRREEMRLQQKTQSDLLRAELETQKLQVQQMQQEREREDEMSAMRNAAASQDSINVNV